MALGKVTIDDIDVKGKKVLVRVDFNVPMKDGKITEDNRIVAALPTIQKLMEKGGRLILCSHLGKPKGSDPNFSLEPCAERLAQLLARPVLFADDAEVVGEKAKMAAAALQDGEVMLLQNTRFRPEETKNLPSFSQELASLCDVYVDDAFGSAHRAHCSTVGVTEYVKVTAVGYLMGKEIAYLGNAVNNPVRPFVAVLGGAKIGDKLKVIDNLLSKVDQLLIGPAMSFTFLKAQGFETGKSLVDEEKVEYCRDMLEKAKEKGVELLLPVDSVIGENFPSPIDAVIETRLVDVAAMPADCIGLDIGPKTCALFAKAISGAKTVVWNGPMGVFENPLFNQGTLAVATAMASCEGTTIIGGGDSAAAVLQYGLAESMTHISTGGGASLEYLEGKQLPGIACIQDS